MIFIGETRIGEGGAWRARGDWGEAWSRLAGASDDAQRYIENLDADEANAEASYDALNRTIHELTGAQLKNPYRLGWTEEERDRIHRGGSAAEAVRLRERAAAEWEAERRALAERHPDIAARILADPAELTRARMRAVEAGFSEAADDPALGLGGRLSAVLAGGLYGAARDPFQWIVATLSGGPGAGRTIVSRIGSVIAREAAINAGVEGVLQAASQGRKRAAGLEHGAADVARNVGIAASFGGLLGGGMQGASELARALRLGRAESEALARIDEGTATREDVEAMAAATGRQPTPDESATMARAAEEDGLDAALVPSDAGPREVSVADAALRHADDPEEYPPAEWVERAWDEARPRSMRLEDYERLYGLEPLDPEDAEEAMSLAPAARVEPLDDVALIEAEHLAGEIAEAPADADIGWSAWDLTPATDANGNVLRDGDMRARLVTVREAIEAAEEDTAYADLLDACKL